MSINHFGENMNETMSVSLRQLKIAENEKRKELIKESNKSYPKFYSLLSKYQTSSTVTS